MRKRHFWRGALQRAWRRRSVVWLSGVRRAGKTTLSRSLPGGFVLVPLIAWWQRRKRLAKQAMRKFVAHH